MANERLEELAQAISEMNPHGKDPDATLLVYDIMWAAICSETERAARFFRGDTPEARLYNRLSHAFHVYGRDAVPVAEDK